MKVTLTDVLKPECHGKADMVLEPSEGFCCDVGAAQPTVTCMWETCLYVPTPAGCIHLPVLSLL